MLMPNSENHASRLSNAHPEPNVWEVHHSASRTFTTNQPAALGTSPDPKSARGASGTARVYVVTSGKIKAHRRTPLESRTPGALAQLGEHQLCKLGVAGSSPARSTTKPAANSGFLRLLSGLRERHRDSQTPVSAD